VPFILKKILEGQQGKYMLAFRSKFESGTGTCPLTVVFTHSITVATTTCHGPSTTLGLIVYRVTPSVGNFPELAT
jgi:hypothetical protein